MALQNEIENENSTLDLNKGNLAPKANALAGLKILVVDDSPDNRELLTQCLTHYAASVVTAENGKAGLEMAMAEDFNVVIMDIQMPVMDGLTATQNLRAAGYRMPIIAHSANALGDIKQQCLQAGFSFLLSKPANAIQIVSAIIDVCS